VSETHGLNQGVLHHLSHLQRIISAQAASQVEGVSKL